MQVLIFPFHGNATSLSIHTYKLTNINQVLFVNFLNFPLVGTQDGWLSLFGALGGGVMTLFGVWWTIQEKYKSI